MLRLRPRSPAEHSQQAMPFQRGKCGGVKTAQRPEWSEQTPLAACTCEEIVRESVCRRCQNYKRQPSLNLPVFVSFGKILFRLLHNQTKSDHAHHKYRMCISFAEWEQRRRNISPESERIYPMIRAAGVYGMTRRQIGSAVALDRDVLDQLLAGMVSAGILTMTNTVNGLVYRSPISA